MPHHNPRRDDGTSPRVAKVKEINSSRIVLRELCAMRIASSVFAYRSRWSGSIHNRVEDGAKLGQFRALLEVGPESIAIKTTDAGAPEDADFHFQRHLLATDLDEFALLHCIGDADPWQPGYAAAGDCHMFQPVGKRRLVDGAEVERPTPAGLDQSCQLAEIAVFPGEGEKGNLAAFGNIDVVERSPVFVGTRHQDQLVFADEKGLEGPVLQHRRPVLVVVCDGEVALAGAQVVNAFEKVGCMHAAAQRYARNQRRADPTREKIHRQCVQGSEGQQLRAGAGDVTAVRAQTIGVAHQPLAALQKHVAGAGQLDRIGAAIDEIGSDPAL